MNLDRITQRYLSLFPGDKSGNTQQRQTPGVLYATVQPEQFTNAKMLHFNEALSEEIGLGKIENDDDLRFLNADVEHLPLTPFATAYAGHQFGNWAGQLGDGRAIFAGEIQNYQGLATELQWKGAGATPYSRHADGRAVLRSTVREYLMSEAMHHLGIPTTRSLSISLTGEQVVRDIMYAGDPKPEPGAVMLRVAPSFLRFGHFELISAQKNIDLLRQLADFTIENYYPEITSHGEEKYLEWFKTVTEKTADLMVGWMRVGFVHGVMNTDNMSALGLSVDYGPYGMLEEFDLNFTPNTTDLPGRRYAYGQQPKVAQWNLWQLANAIFPLTGQPEQLEKILDGFSDYFWTEYDQMLCRKFGFGTLVESDAQFFTDWQTMMQDLKLDYTLFFTWLENPAGNLSYREISYSNDSQGNDRLENFYKIYTERLGKNTISRADSQKMMQAANPKFILRNYLLFEAIDELTAGDQSKFLKLWEALQNPYNTTYADFTRKRPAQYDQIPGCSMLSCSS